MRNVWVVESLTAFAIPKAEMMIRTLMHYCMFHDVAPVNFMLNYEHDCK